MKRKLKAEKKKWFQLQLNEATTQMQSESQRPQSARIVPINQGAHNVNAQRFYHKSHLRQVSQLWSLPTQLIKHAAVEGLLLLTTSTQFDQIRVIQTRPVLREGLCTVSLDLPARHSLHIKNQICKTRIKILRTLSLYAWIGTHRSRKKKWYGRFKELKICSKIQKQNQVRLFDYFKVYNYNNTFMIAMVRLP